MWHAFFFSLLFISSSLIVAGTVEASSMFPRTLRLGDSGPDVLLLQQKLNADIDTRVAEYGPGSPGSETERFGQLTRAAVIRFQEKYAEKILAPIGLSSGTGIVGEATRRVLDIQTPEAPNTEPVTTTPATPITPTTPVAPATPAKTPSEIPAATATETAKKDIYISFPSSYYGPRGSKLTLAGSGFTKTKNTLHLGQNYTISDIPSSSGTSLTVTIPDDAPYGKHAIWIENANGKSINEKFYVITKEGTSVPTITSVTPEKGLYGEQITVRGTNFAPKGNEILTNYHIIKDVSSPDGTTLTFSVTPFPDIPQLQVGVDLKRGIEAVMTFYVVNENGVSDKEKPGKFTIKI